MAEFLKKGGPDGRSGKAAGAGSTCAIMRDYPAVTEFLSCEEWAPGQGRVTGTLLLCVEGGRWRAWVNDRDQGVTSWVSADSLTDLLAAVEGGLRLGGLDWRRAKPGPGQNRGKR